MNNGAKTKRSLWSIDTDRQQHQSGFNHFSSQLTSYLDILKVCETQKIHRRGLLCAQKVSPTLYEQALIQNIKKSGDFDKNVVLFQDGANGGWKCACAETICHPSLFSAKVCTGQPGWDRGISFTSFRTVLIRDGRSKISNNNKDKYFHGSGTQKVLSMCV